MAVDLSGENKYNIGALITRRLATNSSKGDLFGGIYATLILEYLERTAHPDDVPFTFASFDLAGMKRHDVTTQV